MNDHDLIDRLREDMRAHTADTEVPAGFVAGARRAARRRSARRAAAAGTPLLAAAGVAAVLATSGGGSGSASSGVDQAPSLSVGGSQAHDTAFIVKRVRATLAENSDGVVLHAFSDRGAREASDGSLENLGQHEFDQYVYTTADGTQYQRTTNYGQDGRVTGIGFWTLEADGEPATQRVPLRQTSIDPATKTYQSWQDSAEASASRAATAPSGAAEIDEALRSGDVTRLGTTTVDGKQAIALALHKVRHGSRVLDPESVGQYNTLYVDAHTYEPLRWITAFVDRDSRELHDLYVSDWLPITPGDIAKAKDESIPEGYTRVPHTG